MTIKTLNLIVVLFLISFADPSQATRFSGQYLMSVCASDVDGNEITPGGHIACQAYIAGILDYHTLLKSLGTAPGIDFCVPEDAGMALIQKRVQSYVLKNRKQHSSFIAAPGVTLGLHNAFPCE
ncbi:MAG: Rap1a/Tai family immunity protein [Bdellovibrionales bacterium]